MAKYGAELMSDKECIELLQGKGKYKGMDAKKRKNIWNAAVNDESIPLDDLFMTMSRAQIRDINLSDADLEGFNLMGVDFEGARQYRKRGRSHAR